MIGGARPHREPALGPAVPRRGVAGRAAVASPIVIEAIEAVATIATIVMGAVVPSAIGGCARDRGESERPASASNTAVGAALHAPVSPTSSASGAASAGSASREPKPPSAASAVASSPAAPRASRSASPATASTPSSRSPTAKRAEACRIVRSGARARAGGPAALAFLAPDAPRLVYNVQGAPALEAPLLLAPKAAASRNAQVPQPAGGSPAAAEAPRASRSSCAVAGGHAFCMDAEGAIHRRPLSGAGTDRDTRVAHGRKGTKIAAAPLGDRAVLAFLAQRKTTEGVVTQAFAVLDDSPAIPLSEEGSGATSVAIVARGDHLLAVYTDTRSALTPVHARIVRVAAMPGGPRLDLGRDAVIYVAGGSDRWLEAAVGTDERGTAYAIVPTTLEGGGFGMATVRVDGAPADDLPAQTSAYPTSIQPALLAATQGRSPVLVARVRPESAAASSPRLLELGRIDDAGRFEPLCELAKSRSFEHLELAAEGDELWVAYGSAEGDRLEQRTAPP